MKPVAAVSVGVVLALIGVTILGLVDLMAFAGATLSIASHTGVAGR
jgi:hypothetical protein